MEKYVTEVIIGTGGGLADPGAMFFSGPELLDLIDRAARELGLGATRKNSSVCRVTPEGVLSNIVGGETLSVVGNVTKYEVTPLPERGRAFSIDKLDRYDRFLVTSTDDLYVDDRISAGKEIANLLQAFHGLVYSSAGEPIEGTPALSAQ